MNFESEKEVIRYFEDQAENLAITYRNELDNARMRYKEQLAELQEVKEIILSKIHTKVKNKNNANTTRL